MYLWEEMSSTSFYSAILISAPSVLLFFFFFLAVLSLCCHTGLSLVAANPGYSLVAVHRLLTAVSSLCAEHGL